MLVIDVCLVLAGLIPELFPEQRTTAMAAYNSAIYMGRALSFGAVILAGQLGIPTGDIGIQMVRAPNFTQRNQTVCSTHHTHRISTVLRDKAASAVALCPV